MTVPRMNPAESWLDLAQQRWLSWLVFLPSLSGHSLGSGMSLLSRELIKKKRRQESVWVTNTISTTCPNLGWGALCFLRPCCPWFSRIWDFISSSWAQDNVKRCPRLTGKLGAACFSCPIWLDLDQQDLPKRWNTYFPGKNWKLFLHLWSYTEWLSETQ